MIPSKSLFFIIVFFISTTVFSQSSKDSTIVTIVTKSGATLVGGIVYESADSVKISTDGSGIVSIARKEILRDIPILIVTKDENQYKGIVVSDDDKSIVLKTIYHDEITIQKKDIKYEGSKDKYSKIRKNAISFNLLGATPALGITYERLLSKKVSMELGIGLISFGAGVKVYPWNVETDKLMFHTGLVGAIFTDILGGVYSGGYIPLGLSYFGKKGFNFGIDAGPGIFNDDYYSQIIPWGNIKFGFRF